MFYDKIKYSIFPILGILFLILGSCLPIFETKFFYGTSWYYGNFFMFAAFFAVFNYWLLWWFPVYLFILIPLLLIIYGIAIIILGTIKVWKNLNNLRLTNQKWYQWSILIIIFYGLYLVAFWYLVYLGIFNPRVIYSPTIGLVFPFIGGFLIFIGSFLNRKFMEFKEEKVPKRYKDPEWLRIQYHTLKRSIQEIANENRVSVVEIEKQLKLLVPETNKIYN